MRRERERLEMMKLLGDNELWSANVVVVVVEIESVNIYVHKYEKVSHDDYKIEMDYGMASIDDDKIVFSACIPPHTCHILSSN